MKSWLKSEKLGETHKSVLKVHVTSLFLSTA